MNDFGYIPLSDEGVHFLETNVHVLRRYLDFAAVLQDMLADVYPSVAHPVYTKDEQSARLDTLLDELAADFDIRATASKNREHAEVLASRAHSSDEVSDFVEGLLNEYRRIILRRANQKITIP